MSILWINGTFQDDALPVFSATDRVRYGDGVFDTMLALAGKPAHADPHFERLVRHAAVLRIAVSEDFHEIAQALLTKNNLTNAAINTIVTRGESARGLHIPLNAKPTIMMRISPLPDEFPPVQAVIAGTVRRNEGSPLSRIKSLNGGDNILALREAQSRGANEAILLNNAGHVTCATIGNIFAVINGKLATPPLTDGVLDGIVRRLIIERYGAQERSLTPADLQNAQGLYITNSLRGASPVHSLDGKAFPVSAIIDQNIHRS